MKGNMFGEWSLRLGEEEVEEKEEGKKRRERGEDGTWMGVQGVVSQGFYGYAQVSHARVFRLIQIN